MDTFSTVVNFSTIRLIFSIAVIRGWKIQQIDVDNVFINTDIEEPIYMAQPKGFEDPEHPSYV